MFFINWIYALANFGLVLLLIYYIHVTAPGVAPGLSANFSFWDWIRDKSKNPFSSQYGKDEFLVIAPPQFNSRVVLHMIDFAFIILILFIKFTIKLKLFYFVKNCIKWDCWNYEYAWAWLRRSGAFSSNNGSLDSKRCRRLEPITSIWERCLRMILFLYILLTDIFLVRLKSYFLETFAISYSYLRTKLLFLPFLFLKPNRSVQALTNQNHVQ